MFRRKRHEGLQRLATEAIFLFPTYVVVVILMTDKKLTILIEGMHCGHCAAAITEGLKKAKGVKEAETVYTTGKAKVVYDPAQGKPADYVKIVEGLGYKVTGTKE